MPADIKILRRKYFVSIFTLSFTAILKQLAGIMTDITVPGGRICSFVERIENLDNELQKLNQQKKDVFSEAKAEGFDVKTRPPKVG
jgi:hypothetical protein